MKKGYILFIALSSVLFACKKDKDDSKHLTAQIDGKTMTFNESASVEADINSGVYYIYIEGRRDESSTPYLTVSIRSSKLLTTGTYTDTSRNVTVSAAFSDGTNAYSTPGLVTDGIPYNHFVLHVTALDNNTMRGDFSGDIYQLGNFNADKKMVTNGSFYLDIK